MTSWVKKCMFNDPKAPSCKGKNNSFTGLIKPYMDCAKLLKLGTVKWMSLFVSRALRGVLMNQLCIRSWLVIQRCCWCVCTWTISSTWEQLRNCPENSRSSWCRGLKCRTLNCCTTSLVLRSIMTWTVSSSHRISMLKIYCKSLEWGTMNYLHHQWIRMRSLSWMMVHWVVMNSNI